MTGKESASGGGATLTDAQMKFLASMMKNSKSKPDIDVSTAFLQDQVVPQSPLLTDVFVSPVGQGGCRV